MGCSKNSYSADRHWVVATSVYAKSSFEFAKSSTLSRLVFAPLRFRGFQRPELIHERVHSGTSTLRRSHGHRIREVPIRKTAVLEVASSGSGQRPR